ncbi:hypothetical protein CLUG_02583 [Clavispora lusitaniae ATCC 42720]|uniref:Uncharacterized protein n=1 Tax=Clavispora lusitaniae (strain ATCC 42720) TaxID=306902 RepID=C4Y4L1_CLAL4|nr:uncharacterized protein CLUG_02583 [Clavispora lusitaniae ATCC 42720]EEQ38457.1 hypothetical protein CLUG_02583 [Clavispora lusitaniae ATCC 42720]
MLVLSIIVFSHFLFNNFFKLFLLETFFSEDRATLSSSSSPPSSSSSIASPSLTCFELSSDDSGSFSDEAFATFSCSSDDFGTATDAFSLSFFSDVVSGLSSESGEKCLLLSIIANVGFPLSPMVSIILSPSFMLFVNSLLVSFCSGVSAIFASFFKEEFSLEAF